MRIDCVQSRAHGSLIRPSHAGTWKSAAVFIVLWMIAASAVADVRAYLDQSRVYEGDRVQLTIESSGLSPSGEPELAPLGEDFELEGTSTSRQTQIINGRRSDKTSWQISLLPRRVGAVAIPPIRVGDEATEPLSLQVDPIPEGGLGGPGDEVWLEVELEANAEELVVQQQVPLVVRAYSAKPLIDYRIEVPPVDGAVLTRIGRDTGHLITRAGQQYRMIERRFTLNPERSGALRIPSITFEAELEIESTGRPLAARGIPDLFDDPMLEQMLGRIGAGPGLSMFKRGEPVRAQSEALELEIAPSPEGFSGENWLPASDLEVEDSWNVADGGKRPMLAVGEPSTRTLTLIAKGLSGNQIPEIEMPVPQGFRVYPEKTEATTRSDGETVIGVSRQRVTLIPTTGGDVELPPISVPWWDTEAGREQTAVVPSLSVSVAGPVEMPVAGPGEVSNQAAVSKEAGRMSNAPATATKAADSADAPGVRVWAYIAAGSLVALALVSVVIYWYRRRRPSKPRATAVAVAEGRAAAKERTVRNALRDACEKGDPKTAATALMDWAAYRWPDDPPKGLGALAERSGRQRIVIEDLERALYGAGEGSAEWRGAPLWAEVKGGLGEVGSNPDDESPTRKGGLAPLYPERVQQP